MTVDRKMRNGDKLTICLVPDVPDWAYGHISDQLMARLSGSFDFKRIYAEDVGNLAQILLLAEECDIVHVFWRALLSSYWNADVQSHIAELGFTADEFYHRFVEGKIITTEVYDHLLLEGAESEITDKLFAHENSIVTHYAVSSQKLNQIYCERQGLRLRPSAVLPDGVDLDLFRPANIDRLRETRGRTLRFGWAGNSKWWSVEDLKGIGTVIRPAFAQLQKEGYNVELITSDRLEKMIPHHRMPEFYEGIDCYICASLYEGTPNPVLEAMACGVPVITTDVGLVPELFGPRQKEYVLKERSAACLAERIRYLVQHPEDLMTLSVENQKRIRDWSWEEQVKKFEHFWQTAYHGV